MNQPLADLIQRSTYILLDFDGPICDLFSDLCSPTPAKRIKQFLIDRHIPSNHPLQDEENEYEILRAVSDLDPQLTAEVDSLLAQIELEGAHTATPTPNAYDLIIAFKDSGRKLAVVSNNNTSTVDFYLNKHNLTSYIDAIVGRKELSPKLMKPNPYPVNKAIQALKADPSSTVFLGDADSDILAAQAAGIRSIGYANNLKKAARLSQAGADAIIQSMADPLAALTAISQSAPD